MGEQGSACARFGCQLAVITGGARGIGLAIAERLHNEGAQVVLADVDFRKASEQAQRLGERASAYALDVTDPAAWKRVVAAIVQKNGGIDILVNNAGIAGRSAFTWELSPEEWQEVVTVDLTGTFLGCWAVLPHMIERRRGRIINIASIAGKEGNPRAVPYSAAKAGVIGLTKAVAKETVQYGVLVHAVAPAVIATDLLAQVSEEHRRFMMDKVPMQRLGQPHEVAALVAWLASSECSFSTGAVFDLSGGRATY